MKSLHFLIFITVFSESITAQLASFSSFATSGNQNGFIKNIGQVRDLHNKPVDFIYYQANFGGQKVFITRYGLSILLARPKKITRESSYPAKSVSPKSSPADSLTIITWEMERIDIVLKNAYIEYKNIVTTASPGSPQFNFYLDGLQNGQQQEYLQSEVVIKNVYPGIDWKIYIRKDKNNAPALKYDFIIHPGADISRIQLRYSDNAKIIITDNEVSGDTKMGSIHEKEPFSYLQETNEKVNVTYAIKKNTIHFNVATYDKTKTVVIDPSIFWLTYITASNNTAGYQSIIGNDIETDGSGNIFVQLSAAGGIPFPIVNPGGGAYYQDYTASPDGAMILIKFAPGGQMLWSTFFGNGVAGRIMTIDKFGNIIAIGENLGGTPSHPVSNPTIPLLDNGGYYDGVRKLNFITKFSNSGSLLWSSYFTNFSTYPTDMSYDINGNVYVVGSSEIYDLPVVDPGGGAYVVNNAQYGYAQVLFISQFDAGNRLTWSTRIEGNSDDPYARVCTDKAGNIYIGGQARSANYPLVNAGGYFNDTSYAAVISRFNPARKMTWSTHYTGAFTLADVTTDDSCNLYVAIDKRIVKFDSSTNLVYSTSVPTNRMYFWKKINYDPHHDQVQLLGVMNDVEYDFPTLNTACNGSFFNDGNSPNIYSSATDPIFATITHDGLFTYRSLADWIYEYYGESEMTVDINGDPVYLFGDQQDGAFQPNPQLTDPGNGAYFDTHCCYNSNGNTSALLLKLTASELTVTTQVSQPAGCNCNGSATATALCGQTPFIYLWSNGVTTASANNLCPGNYWVTVKDANNLSKTENITIPYPAGSMTLVLPAIIPENCNRSNGAITIQSVQGGTAPYSYSIDGITYSSSSRFTGLVSGNYIIRIKDANGCVLNDTTNVSRITGPSSLAFSVQKSSCAADDGHIQVDAVTGGVGPYQYSLTGYGTNSSGLFINIAAGNYQLIVSDTAGCSLTRPVVIEKATPATNATYTSGDDHCSKGIGFLEVNTVAGGMTPYMYSVDSIVFVNDTINNLSAGQYQLFIKDVNGCVLKKGPVIIGNETGPTDVSLIINNAYCGKPGGDVQVSSVTGGTAPYNYSIDAGRYVISATFTGIQPGNHDVFIKDAFGCIYSVRCRIDYKPIAKIDLIPADTTVCYDEIVSLNLTGELSQARNIMWNIPAQGTSANIKASSEQKVIISITDSNNCQIKDTAIVRVKACNPPEKCLLIPNAFTPNNDGKNETLTPITNGCIIKSINFRVYDRWGELVYETDKQGTGWNGNYHGISEPVGAYVFVCDYVTEDMVRRQQRGVIMLIR